jgi:hypothetical protein
LKILQPVSVTQERIISQVLLVIITKIVPHIVTHARPSMIVPVVQKLIVGWKVNVILLNVETV